MLLAGGGFEGGREGGLKRKGKGKGGIPVCD